MSLPDALLNVTSFGKYFCHEAKEMTIAKVRVRTRIRLYKKFQRRIWLFAGMDHLEKTQISKIIFWIRSRTVCNVSHWTHFFTIKQAITYLLEGLNKFFSVPLRPFTINSSIRMDQSIFWAEMKYRWLCLKVARTILPNDSRKMLLNWFSQQKIAYWMFQWPFQNSSRTFSNEFWWNIFHIMTFS